MTDPAIPASPLTLIRRYLWLIILAFCIGIYSATLDAAGIAAQGHYGLLSIMPAIAFTLV